MALHCVSELEHTVNMTILKLISKSKYITFNIHEIVLELEKMSLKIFVDFQKKK